MEHKLKQKFEKKIEPARIERKELILEHGDKVIGNITLRQIYVNVNTSVMINVYDDEEPDEEVEDDYDNIEDEHQDAEKEAEKRDKKRRI